MVVQQLYTYFINSISILWCSQFLAIAADYGNYNVPWITHTKYLYPPYAPYPTKSHWYPVAGPHTYGPLVHDHYRTPVPHHHFHDYAPVFSHKQIDHIHDVGPPDVEHEHGYEEGNDYNIHNFISHVDTLHQDLVEEGSSKVETRKPIPNTATTNNLNKRRNQNNAAVQKAYSNKRKQTPRRPRPVEEQFRKTMRPRPPTRSTQRQDIQFRRAAAPRKKSRPTRKTHSRRPLYDDDYEYYGRRRENERYRGNRHRYSNREATRQDSDSDYDDNDDDYYYDYDNYDETATTEPTTEETTLAAVAVTTDSTTTTTEFPEPISTIASTTEVTTTVSSEVSHSADLHGYGPSNGHENISITYAPFVQNNPLANWYSQQVLQPDIFQYKNYLSNRDVFN